MHDLDVGHLKMLRDDLLAVEQYLKDNAMTTAGVTSWEDVPESFADYADLVAHVLNHLEQILGIGIYQKRVSS